ncbi:MAG: baseplate multidomain protein megatron [Bosea sp. (in: a-proteobacteria)]
MATLLLSAAGNVIGNALGGPIGGIIGQALGAVGGNLIDQQIFGERSGTRQVTGPRLKEMEGLTSSEGASIPRLYGRARLGGQLIWATRFEEEISTTIRRDRKQGGKGAKKAQKTVETTYSYHANIAVGLCEGRIAFVRRVWADGREIDLNTVTMRVHSGTQTQMPDPLISAKEAGQAPAYRGLAYVVFERLNLTDYGNRVPQFSFEIVRPVPGVNEMIRAITLIPGSSEFAYQPGLVLSEGAPGSSTPENRHQFMASNDVDASVLQLVTLCPNLRRVSLVVSWFGDDLRVGQCTIAPRVEQAAKTTEGATWAVAELERATAQLVTYNAGKPAYGGTPSDASVIALIRRLKQYGLEVVLYPFVMMDIAVGNSLPDPRSGGTGQPSYPWRGRITCDPAPGLAGTVDATAAAGAQVASFIGTVAPADMTLSGETVICAKPNEWSYRRHILHAAMLAQAAGGVSAFIIGSEMIGLTRVRSASGVYPMVAQLEALAQDVRVVLGASTKLVYAADWTEYGAHVLGGGQEVRFPLDPLWASSAIDAIGIDWYPPLTDWRDGTSHADASVARNAADLAYLRNGLSSGEAHDWYYASDAGRAAQARLPITDGAYNKPWTYRAKDLVGWWSNPHVERINGVELAQATAWSPRSKPIWLTEIGIPAVDKGGNGPNVFPDPKSSENAYPPFSGRNRDDLLQMRGLEAILSGFDPALPGFDGSRNPLHPTLGTRMVDPANVYVWTWDARPFPAFPDLASVWADGANWETGHWITGRIEGVALDRLIKAVLADFELSLPDVMQVDGFVDGYVIDRPMSAREALEPLGKTFGFDALLSSGRLSFRDRAAPAVSELGLDDIVPDREGKPWTLQRGQETELPRELRLGFIDPEDGYRRATTLSRRLAGAARRETGIETAIVTRRAEGQRLAELRLQEAWAGRETLDIELSPRSIALEPGDVVSLTVSGTPRLFRLTRINEGTTRKATARAVEPAIYQAPIPALPRRTVVATRQAGRPFVLPVNLPLALEQPTPLQHFAIAADPWPGGEVLWRSSDGASFDAYGFAPAPAIIGETLSALPSGPLWRWDRRTTLDIKLPGTALQSVTLEAALGGANALALIAPDGMIEIISAANATLIGPQTLRLSMLLRGLGGSQLVSSRTLAAGARVVVIDGGLVPLDSDVAALGKTWIWRVGPPAADVSDLQMAEVQTAAGPAALLPLPPVRPKARRSAQGVQLSWIRQTRFGGDSWDVAEVPLAEASERYAVTIYSGIAQKRVLSTNAPEALYATANELTDFGTAQTMLDIAVAQISEAAGPGAVLRRLIPIL